MFGIFVNLVAAFFQSRRDETAYKRSRKAALTAANKAEAEYKKFLRTITPR